VATEGGEAGTLSWLKSAGRRGSAVASADVAVLRLFASAREAAGTSSVDIAGSTVGDVLSEASTRFGDAFVEVLDSANIWLDGEPAEPADAVGAASEVAVLPPVSGGR